MNNILKFNFGKYTEITDIALKDKPEYKKEGYIRFFICADVFDFWFVRILKGYDEEYKIDNDSFLLERNKIPMRRKGEYLTLMKTKNIINKDDYSNWDIEQSYNINVLLGIIDNGFGINNLKGKK